MTETQLGPNTESSASIHLEISKVYALMKKTAEAYAEHSRAVEIYKQFENTDLISVAENAENICELLQAENITGAIECISQAIDIYDNSMGNDNKTSTKLRRKLSLLLLKSGKNNEAMDVLKQVEKSERVIFGEVSLKLFQTYKLIAKVFEIMNNKSDAHAYYSKALDVAVKRKKPALSKEIRDKLRGINKGNE